MQEQLVVDGVTVVNLRNQVMQNPGLYATDAQLFVLLDHINELRTINASLHKRLDKDMGNFVNRNIALTPRGGEEENVGDLDGDIELVGMGLRFSDLDGAHHVSNNDGSESVKIRNSTVSGTVSNPNSPLYMKTHIASELDITADAVSVETIKERFHNNPGMYANDTSVHTLICLLVKMSKANEVLSRRVIENKIQMNTISGAFRKDLDNPEPVLRTKRSFQMRRTIHGVPLPITPLTLREIEILKDAKRWRRLVKCGRIHVFGTSGFKNDAVVDPLQPYHFGVEFHAIHNAEQNPRDLQILTNFADALEVTNFSGVVGLWHKLGHFPTRDEVMDNLKLDKGEPGFKAFCKMIEVPMSFQQEQILDTLVDNKP